MGTTTEQDRIPIDDVDAIEAALQRPLTPAQLALLEEARSRIADGDDEYTHVMVHHPRPGMTSLAGPALEIVREHPPRKSSPEEIKAFFAHIARQTGGLLVTETTDLGAIRVEIKHPVKRSVKMAKPSRRTRTRARGAGRPAARRTRTTSASSSSSGDDPPAEPASAGRPPSLAPASRLTLREARARIVSDLVAQHGLRATVAILDRAGWPIATRALAYRDAGVEGAA